MTLSDFKLKPAPHSKFFFRVRIWETQEQMQREVDCECGFVGECKAYFYGIEGSHKLGKIYLHQNPTLRADAIHEITHAAIFYARDVLHGNLNDPEQNQIASPTEERVCRAMECLTAGWFEEATKLKIRTIFNRPLPARVNLNSNVLRIGERRERELADAA